MTSRAWPVVGIVALVGLGACAGKSRTTRGLETGSSEAGQDGSFNDSVAGAPSGRGAGAISGTGNGGASTTGGTGATHESGGGGAAIDGGANGTAAAPANGGSPPAGNGASGSFAGSGATGARDGTGSLAASASPECVAYHSKSIADACSELVTCGATFALYMDALRAKGVSDWAIASHGCGLIEIMPYLPDEPQTLLTFDAAGDLVGYWITESDRTAPCDDYEYVRGTQFTLGCEAGAKSCRLEPSATSADDLCACHCPDPPPPDGIVIAPRRCVVAPPPYDCRPTAYQEQDVGSRELGVLTPTWTLECGTSVADFLGMQCVYDASGLSDGDYNTGPLLGVRNYDNHCPGVTAWMTEGTPPPCTKP